MTRNNSISATKMWFEHWRCGPGFIARYSRRKGWMNATLLKEERACDPLCKGGQTACQYEVNGIRYTTWATCSDKDHFSYERGREIALGRMIKLLYGKSGFGTEKEIKEQLNKVMFRQGSSDDRYDWIDDDIHGYDYTIPEIDDGPKDSDDPTDYSEKYRWSENNEPTMLETWGKDEPLRDDEFSSWDDDPGLY